MVDEPSQRGSARLVDFVPAHAATHSRPPVATSFDLPELRTILNLYGRKVAAGEWRDYAMDFQRDRALFSVYRRSSERPVYVIEKCPRLRNRQGQYLVTGQDGRILKRGHELTAVLRVLEAKRELVK